MTDVFLMLSPPVEETLTGCLDAHSMNSCLNSILIYLCYSAELLLFTHWPKTFKKEKNPETVIYFNKSLVLCNYMAKWVFQVVYF